ncbi:sensor histidine kinase [Ferruginibacter sp.]|nr:histidine kinase [Ferruginibacter sp.]
MGKTNIRYWLCQIIGWGVFGLIHVYINLVVYGENFAQHGGENEYLVSLAVFLISGIICTHLLRTVIKKTNWLKFSLNKVWVVFIAGIVATSLLQFYGGDAIEKATPYSFEKYIQNYKLEKAKKSEASAGLDKVPYYNNTTPLRDSINPKAISDIKKSTGWHRNKSGEWKYEDKTELLGIYQNILLIALWFLIYIVYHYLEKNRKDQLDRLKLESTVKELELKTIKSHINPHFIFNSLNSIRALVDENPERARTAITELSNILRSSMQAEKSETVSLQRELDIVTDYLALEHMRFEERLKVELDIDQDTLTQQVPPMMLQTLVENSIKHGISKLVNGGLVRIITNFKGDNLELLVQNTGQLNGKINADGFGIKSTQDRLNLMYQGKAHFEIKNMDNNMVQSKVTMPVII